MTARKGTPPLEFASPPTNIDEYVDAFHDGEELRFKQVDTLSVKGELLCWLVGFWMTHPELLLVSTEEPPTFTVPKRDANWHQTMLEEMRMIEAIGLK